MGVIGLSGAPCVVPETRLGLDMNVASEDRRGIEMKVVSEVRRGLVTIVASLNLHSISLLFLLLSASVGSLPKVPTLVTVSSRLPFSQQSALSYLSRLFL